jgi:hypothetical protein
MPVNAIFSIYGHSLKALTQHFIQRSRNLLPPHSNHFYVSFPIVLVTEGKEEQTYNQSMYAKNSINKAIMEKNKLTGFLSLSSR